MKDCYIRNKIGCICEVECGYNELMKDLEKPKRGGKRKGSGRKKKEPTTTIRVPKSKVEEIKDLISPSRKQKTK